MDQFTKEGRKLRPRKTSTQSRPNFEKVEYTPGERKSYGERQSYGDRQGRADRPNYGERRSYGERQSYGDRPNYGERRPRQYGENRGERQGYGDRPNYGERQSHPERQGYGERRGYGERQSYGDRPNYGENRGERQGYGERQSYGERQNYGERPNYGERQSHPERQNRGERPNYGERKPRQYGENRGGGRPGNGRKKGFKRGPNPHSFNKNSYEGISRMIDSRPVVNGSESAENYTFPVAASNEVRLNKFIANSGVCSRREADTLIQAGVVTVNGEVVTELGTKINVLTDEVKFNGERLKGEEKVYIIMNKPRGFVTTASDPHADKTVVDLIKGCPARVYPVGRLDKNTTGVLMLTNDGEIAERLTHPSYDKKKIYQVALDKDLQQEDFEKILSGVQLTDGEEKADDLQYIDPSDKRKVGIEIHSGKNRIVRRIFETLGYNVKALDRVYFAGLTKKGLKKGEWRFLTEGETNILKMGAYV